jgi:hypothetical protein
MEDDDIFNRHLVYFTTLDGNFVYVLCGNFVIFKLIWEILS